MGGGHSRTKRVLLLAIVALIAVSAAAIAASSQKHTTRVASGRIGPATWTLRMSKQHGSRCFGLDLVEDMRTGSVSCEPDLPPPQLWQRRIGAAGESAAVELDVTRPGVWRLELLLGHPGRESSHSTLKVLHTRAIPATRARRTRVEPNFRYAVVTGRGPNLCVKRVRAFSRSGELLEKTTVPCEY